MPERQGMGGTVVAVALIEDRLHWISVGDSVLYLWREGRLKRLNRLCIAWPKRWM